jgi:hypothetical protein
LVAEYLEHALQFERMAAEEADPKLKESLLKQAKAYRKLAGDRVASLQKSDLPPAG